FFSFIILHHHHCPRSSIHYDHHSRLHVCQDNVDCSFLLVPSPSPSLFIL
ncbi:unnamed protein product, partial [Musa acuminata subsp. burmannicoides]